MEGDLRTYPLLAYPLDRDAEIDVSKLSALLVATMQEAKDRISEVEHMFCSQLFPDYQAKSVNLLKVYSESRKAVEASREREKDLLLEIEKLQLERQQYFEASQSLKLEKAKFEKFVRTSKCIIDLQEDLKNGTEEAGEGNLHESLLKHIELKADVILKNESILQELEEKINLLIQGRRSLGSKADKERQELKKDFKKVEGEVELHNKLVQLVQANAMWVQQKETLLKEHEEMTTKELLGKIANLEEKVDELEMEVISKSKQIDRGKESYGLLFKDSEKEKRVLTAKLETLVTNVKELQEEIRKKNEEVEESRNLQEQLCQQIDLNGLEMLKAGREMEELLKVRSLHVAKLKGLEEKVDKLQSDIRDKSMESAEGMELHGKLLKQIEAKDFELLSEKKKRRNVIDSYKRLKSQYNFLCARNGLTPENMLTPNKREDERDSVGRSLKPSTSPDERDSVGRSLKPSTSPGTGDNVSNSPVVNHELTRQHDNQENLIDNGGVVLLNRPNSDSPCSSSSPLGPQGQTNLKSSPLSGTKRPVSYWRETRSHQKRGGPDPHDDFFNTPMENIRGNLKKATKEEVHDIQSPVPKDMQFPSSDDETQNFNVDPHPAPTKQQAPPPNPEAKGFKYVEPVRKKADRETLKGIECKQCKKFYDAVLPDGGGKGSDGNKQNLRCEHHEGVSRHRYRYAPPSTPEGFWNIGFESEM